MKLHAFAIRRRIRHAGRAGSEHVAIHAVLKNFRARQMSRPVTLSRFSKTIAETPSASAWERTTRKL